MTITAPTRSCIVWFTQRVGSTLLTQALEDMGVAGRPREWLNYASTAELLAGHAVSTAVELREELWRNAMTDNGVIGLKYGMLAALHRELLAFFAALLDGASDPDGRLAWEAVFPSARHVFMTRRNKIRLAVSWWRAITSNEWHRPNRPTTVVGEQAPKAAPTHDKYSYDAIDHLFAEASVREADIQEQFTRWNIVPHTVVYEDLVADYEATVRGVVAYLQLPDRAVPAAAFAPIGDEVAEAWTQRFRRERGERLKLAP